MAVYLVYRHGDSSKRIQRFEADSLLEWVRSIWVPVADLDEAFRHAESVFGMSFNYSGYLFHGIAEQNLPLPDTMEEAMAGFSRITEAGADVWSGPHHLEIWTDYKRENSRVYLFDDHYRAANPGRADFLLLPDLFLPDGCADAAFTPDEEVEDRPPGDGEGATYVANLSWLTLGDPVRPARFNGVRIPDLCRHLLLLKNEEEACYLGLQSTLCALRDLLANATGEEAGFATALRESPGDPLHWNAYSDWLHDRGLPPAGLYLLEAALRAAEVNEGDGYYDPRIGHDPAADQIRVTPTLVQCARYETDRKALCEHLTLFGDRWAAAHPGLANALLRYAAGEDYL